MAQDNETNGRKSPRDLGHNEPPKRLGDVRESKVDEKPKLKRSLKDELSDKVKGGANQAKSQIYSAGDKLKASAKDKATAELKKLSPLDDKQLDKVKSGVNQVKKAADTAKKVNQTFKVGKIGAKAGLLLMIYQKTLMVLNAAYNAVFNFVMNFIGVFKAIGGAIASGFSSVVSSVAGLFSVSAHAVVMTASVAAVSVSTGVLGYNVLIRQPIEDSACSVSANENSSIIGDNIGGAAANNWSQVGTTAYNNAKMVWDYWKGKGFSGAAIAGIIANAAHEGGFDIADRAEGHHGSSSQDSGISAGVEPSGGSGYAVGGGGIYQFTPYIKFAPLGDAKWLDINAQNDFVWTNEVSKYMQKCPYGNGSGGVGSYYKYAHLADPAQAAKAWFAMFERGAKFSDVRSFDATKAYEVFGGSQVIADDTLLGGSNNSADINSGIASALDKAACSTDNSVADGTGSISESSASGVIHWGRDSVPADVKQFIHDPRDAGLSLGNATGWFNGTGTAADQCVGFASSYFYAIWSGLQQVYVDAGKNAAKMWSDKNGGSVTTTPKAGAIASVGGGVSGISSDGPYGHTWVVLHVLQNGDTIIVEQNMPSLSGAGNGEKNTWNFGWISAQKAKEAGVTYYVPEGKTLNWNKK